MCNTPWGVLWVELMTRKKTLGWKFICYAHRSQWLYIISNEFLKPLTVVVLRTAGITVSHIIGDLTAKEFFRTSPFGFSCSRFPSVRPRVSYEWLKCWSLTPLEGPRPETILNVSIAIPLSILDCIDFRPHNLYRVSWSRWPIPGIWRVYHLCTDSSFFRCWTWYGIHAGIAYSMCGLTNVRYKFAQVLVSLQMKALAIECAATRAFWVAELTWSSQRKSARTITPIGHVRLC
mgnify:CR=1 FL=1